MTKKQQMFQQLEQKGWQIEDYDSDEHGCWIYFVSLDKKSNINHMQVASTDMDKLHLISNDFAEHPIEGAVFTVENELKKIIKKKKIDVSSLSTGLGIYITKTAVYQDVIKAISSKDNDKRVGSFFVFRAFARDLNDFVLRPFFTNDSLLTPREIIETVSQIIQMDNQRYQSRYKRIKVNTDPYLKTVSREH